jgi:hypothetical protein
VPVYIYPPVSKAFDFKALKVWLQSTLLFNDFVVCDPPLELIKQALDFAPQFGLQQV